MEARPSVAESAGALRCSTVQLNEKELIELDDDLVTPLVRIPRATIVRIEAASGFEAERPILQGLFGLTLLFGGGWVAYPYAGFPRSLGCLVALGCWAVYRAVKRGVFLRVETRAGSRKI